MNNYEKMQEAARLRFLQYDPERLGSKPGVTNREDFLETCFLGELCRISKTTGHIFFPSRGESADFSESLCVYDWLCDRREDAVAANRFCMVHSLPGIVVSGSGLTMNCDSAAHVIAQNKQAFLALCDTMGGKSADGADFAVIINAFPDLPVLMKFYDADEEFPASLSLLWDENVLQFLRYETVYYLAGCLLRRLKTLNSYI